MTTQQSNPLATDKISTLIARFSVPSIIAMLVSAVYNIADQLFIGNAVGTLGNAATNIAFPLAMMCTGLGLLFGIGGAAAFNLHMGANKKEEAPYFVGNSIMMLMTTGVLLFLLTELFLTPLLIGFGSPSNVLPLARQYVRVTAIGFPFLILTIGSGHLIRADGSPKMAMFVNISGAVINIALDAVFVLIFKWGMYGAAAATVIGQVISTIIAVCYLLHYRTVKLERQHLIPNETYLGQICSLGMASAINQVAMMIVQITMNNLLKKYGAQSAYGDAIPIACAGIVMKVNQLYFSVIIGLSQGSQPIQSFNYGAKQYQRVKDSYRMATCMISLPPRFPAVYLVELYAADFVDLLQFNWKGLQGNLPVPDETDSVSASAAVDLPTFLRNHGSVICQPGSRFTLLYRRTRNGDPGVPLHQPAGT